MEYQGITLSEITKLALIKLRKRRNHFGVKVGSGWFLINCVSHMKIDITFDTRTDSNGKDPDFASRTLRQFHKTLWSKPLPNSRVFTLSDSHDRVYLYHNSELGEFRLSSDAITHSYSGWKRMQHIISQISQTEIENFFSLGCTVGSYIIFPYNKVEGTGTINQARGVSKKINDRFDLTLECIRLFYLGQESPLFKTFNAYTNFFHLFQNFQGYCEFFLLQDLVSKDFSKVRFFLPFSGFVHNPLPQNVEEYIKYRKNVIAFIQARNERINLFTFE